MADQIHTEGEPNSSAARARWQADNIGPLGRQLLNRDTAGFLRQTLSTPCLSTIARAQGIWIEDADGNRFMDFHGNSVHHIGYGHPRLLAAIKTQLDDLSFAPRRFTNDVAVQLAERLAGLAPAAWKEGGRVLFTTGGSDANEVALKIARKATGRFKTLSFWHAFHGAGFGAASVGGEATFRSHGAGPLLAGSEHVPPFACYRCPYGHDGPDTCGLACAGMVRFVLETEGDIGALIAEPMRAVPYVAPKGFWAEVRRACDDHGVLLIFDEIPTGLGKTGRFFAHEHDEATPDIITLGKALGGGVLPIAAVLARASLDVSAETAIGHYTHEKNPVTARAALTTLDIIRDEDLVARADTLGADARARLLELAERSPIIGDVRGRGLMLGVEIVSDKEAGKPDNELAERIFYRCLGAGLSFKISQGNVLTLSPPLIIEKEDLESALTILETAIASVSGG